MPEPLDSEPAGGSGDVTAVNSPRLTLESAMADMVAWRRDAEKKLAYLESELAQLRLRAVTAVSAGAPKPDLQRDPTAPLFPEFSALNEARAATSGATSGATFGATSGAISGAILGAPASLTPSPTAASITPAYTQPSVVSIARRVEARPQYDLEMRPGEHLDIPSELDGGKRKRFLVGFLMLVLVAGMATLVITALASQR